MEPRAVSKQIVARFAREEELFVWSSAHAVDSLNDQVRSDGCQCVFERLTASTVTFCRSPLHLMPPPFPKCQIGILNRMIHFHHANRPSSFFSFRSACRTSDREMLPKLHRRVVSTAVELRTSCNVARNPTHFGSGCPHTLCPIFQSSWVLSGFCGDADQVLYSLIFETKIDWNLLEPHTRNLVTGTASWMIQFAEPP